MKSGSVSKFLQDVSAILASILPIAQLFFYRFDEVFDKVFIAKEHFLGVSIITLLLSYIFIIAYLTKPYAELVLPFQGKRKKKLQDYYTKTKALNDLLNTIRTTFVSREQTETVNEQINKLEQPARPVSINGENQVSVYFTVVLLSALIFISTSFLPDPNFVIGGIQSVAYMFLIAFAALMLTLYKKLIDQNREWKENNVDRTRKSIELAVSSNCFGNLPQVKFIAQFESDGFPRVYHVIASYKESTYDIVTDANADYLISFEELPQQPQQ